jgi:hypothetical protein
VSDGVRVDRKTTEVLGAGEHLRMLRDQLLIEPLSWEPSKLIQVTGGERRPLRGVVRLKGPGCYPKRYSADRSRSWDSRAFRRTEVEVGDVIELGGLEIDGYMFPQIMVEGRTHIICREEDVAIIVE